MKIIGISGGIGSGKSVVSRILRCKGYCVYDCDSKAKQLMAKSASLKKEIAQEIGEECIALSGEIDTGNLAKKIFNDSSKREWLNCKVHSMVREDIEQWIATLLSEKVVFIESAIPYSSGLASMMDEILWIEAPEKVRIARAMQRDCSSINKIKARIDAQQEEYKGKTPDCIIKNYGRHFLLQQIDNILNNQ